MFGVHSWSSLLVITVGILWRTHLGRTDTRIVCYYTNWSVYRPGTAKFSPQNINPYLCTHLVYAFGGFTKESAFKPFDKYQDIDKGGYSKFTGLKTYNKDLKTLMAIGGWNEGSSRFSTMVANAEKRREFVKNSVKFLRQNHFDGLDLDWEYPSFRDGGKPHDKGNYATLVQELREEYDKESEKTGRPRLLLTMAAPAGIEYINKGYDIPKLMKYLDWVNVLSYDYHSAFEPSLNHHAPLYSLEEESEYNYESDLNVNHTVHHYLELGADRDKLVLGIPTYGRSYTLFNPDATNIGDAADGPGEMGEATRENGYLSYYEICERIKSDSNWIVKQRNTNAVGPYAYKDNQWVGYDDESIVKKKAKYVVENRLGGIMFWSIDNDDFRGSCHGRPYPLIEAAKEALTQTVRSESDNTIPAKEEKPRFRNRIRKPSTRPTDDEDDVPKSRKRTRNQDDKKPPAQEPETTVSPKRRLKTRRTTTTTSTTTTSKTTTPHYQTPEPPATPDPGGDFKCEEDGFFPHPRDCKKYFWCLSGPSDSGITAHQFTCPSGLYFNKLADSCDYTQNVLCSKKSKTTAASPTTTTSTTTYSSTSKAPTTTTTTTTPAPEEVYEEEYEDDVDTPTRNAEEDPKVIKELIDLIKKAGGIEELEKQLKLNENGAPVTAPGSTTPSAFNKSLYERILANRAKLSMEKSPARNSRGPQYEKSSATSTESSLSSKKARPQYIAISRQRSTTEGPPEEEPIEDIADGFKATKPNYKTISRSRPSTSGSEVSSTVSARFNDAEEEVSKQRPLEYVTLRRSRPTTAEAPLTLSTSPSPSSTPVTENEIRNHSPTTSDVSSDSANTVAPFTAHAGDKIEETTLTTATPSKVSDSVSPRNLLRTRIRGSNLLTQRLNTITERSENIPRRETSRVVPDQNVSSARRRSRPTPTTERPEISSKREGSRFSPDKVDSTNYGRRYRPEASSGRHNQFVSDDVLEGQGSYDENVNYDRKFRPDITAEVADLSSLTSVDLSNNRRRNSNRRTLVRRLRPAAEELQDTDSNAVPEVRKQLASTVRPSSRSYSIVQRRRLESTPNPTTENAVTSSKPMRKIVRRMRVTTESQADENLSLENEDSIRLSESEIRLNSLNGNDRVRNSPLGKHIYNGESDSVALTETYPAQRTRKTDSRDVPLNYDDADQERNRKVLRTSTTQQPRPRKIIRRLRPTTDDTLLPNTSERHSGPYEIPVSQRRRKLKISTSQDTSQSTTESTPSRPFRIFSRSTNENKVQVEDTYSTVPYFVESVGTGLDAFVQTSDVSNDLNSGDLASTLAVFASVALEHRTSTSDFNTVPFTSAPEHITATSADTSVSRFNVAAVEPMSMGDSEQQDSSASTVPIVDSVASTTLVPNLAKNSISTKPVSILRESGVPAKHVSSLPGNGVHTKPVSVLPENGASTKPVSVLPENPTGTKLVSIRPESSIGTSPVSFLSESGIGTEPISIFYKNDIGTVPVSILSESGTGTEPISILSENGFSTQPVPASSKSHFVTKPVWILPESSTGTKHVSDLPESRIGTKPVSGLSDSGFDVPVSISPGNGVSAKPVPALPKSPNVTKPVRVLPESSTGTRHVPAIPERRIGTKPVSGLSGISFNATPVSISPGNGVRTKPVPALPKSRIGTKPVSGLSGSSFDVPVSISPGNGVSTKPVPALPKSHSVTKPLWILPESGIGAEYIPALPESHTDTKPVSGLRGSNFNVKPVSISPKNSASTKPVPAFLKNHFVTEPIWILPESGTGAEHIPALPESRISTIPVSALPDSSIDATSISILPENDVSTEPVSTLPENYIGTRPVTILPENVIGTEPVPALSESCTGTKPVSILPEHGVGTEPVPALPESRAGTKPVLILHENGIGTEPVPTLPESRAGTKPVSILPVNGYSSKAAPSLSETYIGTKPVSILPENGIGTEPVPALPESRAGTKPFLTLPESSFGTKPVSILPENSIGTETVSILPRNRAVTNPISILPKNSIRTKPAGISTETTVGTKPVPTIPEGSISPKPVSNLAESSYGTMPKVNIVNSPPPYKNRIRPTFLQAKTSTEPSTTKTTQRPTRASRYNRRKTTTESPKDLIANEVVSSEIELEDRFSDVSSTAETPSSKRTTRRYTEFKRTTTTAIENDAKISRNKLFANRNRKLNTPSTTEPPTTTPTFHHIFSSTTTTTTPAPSFPKDKKVERLIEVNRIVEVSLKENKIQKHHPTVQNEFTLVPSVDRVGAINRITEIKIVDPERNAIEDTSTAKAFTPKPNVYVEASTIPLEALFSKSTDELLETENAHYVHVRILDQDDDRSKRYRFNEEAPILPIRVLKHGEVGSRARVIEVTPSSGSSIIKIAPISISLSQTSVN